MKTEEITYQGLKFFIRPTKYDVQILNEVIKRKCYKHLLIKKDETWLDIGANIGAFSVLYSKKGTKIHSYEPERDNFFLLQNNLEFNKLNPNLACNYAVVGNQDKTRRLFLNEKKNMGAHSFFINKRRKKFVEVMCININDILTPEIDGIKIDTEGTEYEIITAINDFKNVKKIIFEYHFNIIGKKKYFKLIEFLKDKNFKVKYLKKPKKYWHTNVFAERIK